MNRRTLLQATAAGFALPPFAVWADAKNPTLTAATSEIQLLPEKYGKTQVWAFDGIAPGPEIRVKQGQSVRRRVINNLSVPTSVHWHGIRIDNRMDGVAGLTQPAIEPGDQFDYDFVAPDAGTYWYHSHSRSFEQVARGLHGALIVDEAEPVDVDRDEVLVLDDWLIDPDTAQIAASFGAMHDLSHAGRLGNYVTTNGKYNLAKSVARNERLRLRLINASNARIFQLALDGLEGWIVAFDGMPLSQPSPVQDTFVLAPAQRIDLIVDVTAGVGSAGHVVQLDRNESFSQVAFEVMGERTRARRPAPLPLPPNLEAKPDLSNARDVTLTMEGGAMGKIQEESFFVATASLANIASSLVCGMTAACR